MAHIIDGRKFSFLREQIIKLMTVSVTAKYINRVSSFIRLTNRGRYIGILLIYQKLDGIGRPFKISVAF